ncbi:MAG: DUF433 domain-containing protein [Schlesneria sp.]
MKWQDRITIKPDVCHGKACIKDTRVMVSMILANLSEGETYESIMSNFHVMREDIEASIAFGADMAEDRFLPLSEEAA